MTKNLNFALTIKWGGREDGTCTVFRPCHPPPKKNLKRAPGGKCKHPLGKFLEMQG